MSDFDTEAAKFGRRPFVLVELDLDFCGNDYGVAPCTASRPAGLECFNGFLNCQDKDNYSKTTKTYTYSDILLPGSGIPPLVDSPPKTAPSEITPAKGLGARANATVKFKDVIDDDSATDPYVSTRGYIATDQGTYWGKFFARNGNYYGREMRIKYGFLGASNELTNVETYTYLIDRFERDSLTGEVTLVGKDPLMKGDALKAKVPVVTTGKLASALSSSATSFSVGVGEGAEYALVGKLSIDKEIIDYTRVGDVFTVVGGVAGRGYAGSTAASHSSGATAQEVWWVESDRVDDVVEKLCLDAEIPSAFLDTVNWEPEVTTWLGTYLLTAYITKPVEINKLLGELTQQCGFVLFSDDRDGALIKLKAEVPLLQTELDAAPIYTDASLIKDSLRDKDETKLRISRVWIHHDLIDPTDTSRNKKSNFEVTTARVNANSDSANAYNQKQIKEMYSRWLRSDTAAALTCTRTLARFANPPKSIRFKLDASVQKLNLGDHFFLLSKDFQDEFGAANQIEFQCTALSYDHGSSVYIVKALQFRFASLRQCIVAPNSTPVYTSASESDKGSYGFLCDEATGQMSNGDDAYHVV